MQHLTAETLARLVDEEPTEAERAHLDSCAPCAKELAGYGAQTRALRSLPEILPPRGDWGVLEARLRSEGLVRDPGLLARLGLGRTPGWVRVAASLLLFGLGAFSGATLAPRAGQADPTEVVAEAGQAGTEALDGAEAAVRMAEQRYVEAMTRYRELAARSGGTAQIDPISRYAALEHLVLAGQAAVRQAPGDPYLNGLLASALAEREATARLVSSGEGWF